MSRWSVLAAFMALGAATQVAWVIFAPVTTVAATHYGVSADAIGWSAQVFPLLYIVLAVPAGVVLDRWFRGGLAAGALLTIAGSALRLIGDGYTPVLIGQIVIAIGQPLVLNAITGLAARYLSEEDRPRGIALGAASTFGGMLIAFGLGAVWSEPNDVHTLIVIGTVISLVSGGAMLVALRRPAEFDPGAARAGLSGVRDVLRHRFVMPLLILVAGGFGLSIALMTWLQALLEPTGISATTAGVLLLIMVLAGAIGSAVVPPPVAKRDRQPDFFVVAIIAGALGCAVLATGSGAIVAAVMLALIGFFLLAALPVVLEMTERRLANEANTAAGLVWMAGNVGGFLVTFAIAPLNSKPALAFPLLAVIAALGIVPITLLRRRIRVIDKAG